MSLNPAVNETKACLRHLWSSQGPFAPPGCPVELCCVSIQSQKLPKDDSEFAPLSSERAGRMAQPHQGLVIKMFSEDYSFYLRFVHHCKSRRRFINRTRPLLSPCSDNPARSHPQQDSGITQGWFLAGGSPRWFQTRSREVPASLLEPLKAWPPSLAGSTAQGL